MFIIQTKNRGKICLSARDPVYLSPEEQRTGTADLPSEKLLKLAELGRAITVNPIQMLVVDLMGSGPTAKLRLGFDKVTPAIKIEFDNVK